MLYYTVVLTRKAGLSQKEFERLWLVEHLAMARTMPGLVSAQFYPIAGSEDDVEFGGFGVLCFPDQEALDAAVASEAGQMLRQHTPTFADPSRTHRLVARDPVGFIADR